MVLVGDDTGLVKKLSMTIGYQDEVISMPDKRRNIKKRTFA